MIQKKRKGYKLAIEDRIKYNYQTYGIKNHAEFVNYMNPHDNCLWDAIIPGYNFRIKPDKLYKVTNILGYVYIPDGNFKIIANLNVKGFSPKKFIEDINTFMDEYSFINNVPTDLILF